MTSQTALSTGSRRAASVAAAIRSSRTPEELVDVLVGYIEELTREREAARSQPATEALREAALAVYQAWRDHHLSTNGDVGIDALLALRAAALAASEPDE